MGKKIYSYHNFIFPFLWNDNGNIDIDDFLRILSVGNRWHEKRYFDSTTVNDLPADEWKQYYTAYQYFTENANNIIFNTRNDNIVKCFEYRDNGKSLNGRARYNIEKNGRTYSLNINNIRLNVYDMGIAMLVFELENDLPENSNLDAVNAINEYGRRVNMPFLPKKPEYSLCADSIKINIDGKDVIASCENFAETLNEINTNINKIALHISFDYVMKLIQYVLDGNGKDNGGYKVTSNRSHKSLYNLYICPAVDDRMFVCSLIADSELANKYKTFDSKTGEYEYMKSCYYDDEKSLANELYKFCFIETSCTCQSKTMQKKLLGESIYDRWIDYGTLHGVSYHSLICLTGDPKYTMDTVVIPFLTEYVQMAILAVAQRTAILMLSSEVSNIANSLGNDIQFEDVAEIETLQAKYVRIHSQILLPEVTVQGQGIEIYKLLRDHLDIDKNKNDLDIQMQNLRDVNSIYNERLERQIDEEEKQRNTELEKRVNILAIIFVLAGIWEPIGYLCTQFICHKNDGEHWLSSIVWFVGIVVLTTICAWVYFRNGGLKKNGKR